MRRRTALSLALFLAAAFGVLTVRLDLPRAQPAGGSQVAAAPQEVIRAESRLVLVDLVATDKKGNYIKDLDAKDIQVFEDHQPQTIVSFARARDAQSPNGPRQARYIVFFFDNSTMSPSDQVWARRQASQFAEKAASPDRLMAVVDFGGTLQISQNFTSDGEKLARAMASAQSSFVSSNASAETLGGSPSASLISADFGARTVLLAIRTLAKNLRTVPGRKTLILFSEGFPLTSERESELSATIDAANKANVAIYPVDVRGLVPARAGNAPPFGPPLALFLDSPFPHEAGLRASLIALPEPSPAQRGGTGGGVGPVGGGGTRGGGGTKGGGGTSGGKGGGGTTGGSGGGTKGSGGGSTTNPARGRQIIPPIDKTVGANQQVLYALATGTGGFPILNTNDLLEGLNKIAQELDEYYILGYVPPSREHDGSYHTIDVKASRGGMNIRHRNGYFDLKSPDLLAGQPEGKTLEAQVASSEPGNVPVTFSAPYFYSSPGVARVNIALQIPASEISFEKQKKGFHSEVNVLAIAYREDGSVAARFSDTVKLDMEKKDVKEFSKGSFPYQNTFDIAPGKYTLKLVLSAGGEKFAKYEAPLIIAPFDGKKLAISGAALSNTFRPVDKAAATLNAALLEDQTPMIYQGVQVFPSPGNHFKRGEKVGFYVEVFEPLMQSSEVPRVGVLFNIVDRKTNQPVYSSNTILLDPLLQAGNPLIPVLHGIPTDNLQAGEYRLEVRARDSAGAATPLSSADFVLE